MLVATQIPLTSELLPCLSAGAIKLWQAVQLEPNQPQARYVELVGLCKRRVRDFTRELLNVGLVQRTTGAGQATRRADRPDRSARVDRAGNDAAALFDHEPAGCAVPDTFGAQMKWLSDLSDAERGSYDALRAFGVDERGSRYWAKQGDQALIDAALAFTRDRLGSIARPAAYLVWCLNHPAEWYGPAVSAFLVAAPPMDTAETLTGVCIPLPAADGLCSPEAIMVDVPIATDPPSEIAIGSASELALAMVGAEGVTLAVPDDALNTVLMAYAVEAATGTDVRLSAEAHQTVQILQQAGYTAEDVALFAEAVFPRQDWRGQKGEKPTLRALLEGIATVRHDRIEPCVINAHSLLFRVKALRQYLPVVVHIRTLADLWSAEVRQAVDEAERMASTCPECALPIAMCRCGQTETYSGGGTEAWTMLIGELEVQLGGPTFGTWVRSLRLIGFESSAATDKYIVECKNRYQHEWLKNNLLEHMTERLSTVWANKPSHIDLRIAPLPRWVNGE